MVMGTCVETIDKTTSAALASTVTTQGNFAMCHWMYFDYAANTAVLSNSATTNAWGDSKYLATAAWGTNGAATTGAGATNGGNSQGTSLTLAANGLAFSPAAASPTTFAAGAYTMAWYQPKEATTYAAGSLRRYLAGLTANAESVKGYCVSMRKSDNTSHVTGGFVAGATVVLSGSAALAMGAAALLGSAAFIF